MKSLERTSRFRRDVKRLTRRGKDQQKLVEAVSLLLAGEDLPARMRPHKLSGEYAGLWECHIEPDWLLIYDDLPDAADFDPDR